jgi:HSP20 family protein
MKINDKYEISPFGNAFDSLFSLLTRNDQSPISNYSSSISEYGNVRIKNEEKQVRIEFLVPGWKKNDLSLSIEDQKLRLSSKPSKDSAQDGLFQSKELDVQVLLGEKLDTNKTNAKLEQGVLTVTIPVTSKVTGKSIKIS